MASSSVASKFVRIEILLLKISARLIQGLLHKKCTKCLISINKTMRTKGQVIFLKCINRRTFMQRIFHLLMYLFYGCHTQMPHAKV